VYKSIRYWNDHQHKYPFQIDVPHKSDQDIDPRIFGQLTGEDFIRVPFDGVAHWGFKSPRTLELFQAYGEAKRRVA
jgi:hypothetical protein